MWRQGETITSPPGNCVLSTLLYGEFAMYKGTFTSGTKEVVHVSARMLMKKRGMLDPATAMTIVGKEESQLRRTMRHRL
jgi:hypothetical protein